VGWKFTSNSILRYGLDFKDSVFQVQGTVAATNGSTSVTGTGTSFVVEIMPGDQVIFQGVNPYTVASVASATQLTLATAYAETTASGLAITKYPHPIRMGPNSFITAHDLSDTGDYRLVGLTFENYTGNFWSFAPDDKGVSFGGNVRLKSRTQSTLGSPLDGTLVYCTNCNQNSTCTSGGSGALAKRIAAHGSVTKIILCGSISQEPVERELRPRFDRALARLLFGWILYCANGPV
jgi:hypothetical protein